MTPRPSASGAPKKARWSAAKKAGLNKKAAPIRKDRASGTRATERDARWSRPERSTDGPRSYRDDRRGSDSARTDRDDRRSYGSRDSNPRSYGDRDSRPSYGDRDKSRSYGDRDKSRSYGDRDSRPSYGDRDKGRSYGDRDSRPSYNDRDKGRSYGDRDSRPSYGDRDKGRSYGDRDSRPSYNDRDKGRSYGDRDSRPSYGDRDKGRSYGDRDSRPSYNDRDKGRSYGDRDSRPSYGDRDKGRSYGDRDSRPSYNDRDKSRSYGDRDSRPSYNDRDKGRSYGDRDSRPSYGDRDKSRSYGQRPDRDRVQNSDAPAMEDGQARAEVRRAPRERDLRVSPPDASRAEAERMRRVEAPIVEPVEPTESGFADLGLPDSLVRRLARDGISEPFPIQIATIPDALAGRDVLGRGRTGSGKTLAFGLPVLTRLAKGERSKPRRPRALILSPTRELAMQISDALQPLVHVIGLSHKLVAGGMPYPPQFQALDRGVDLLIATPGRLNDLIERKAVSLDSVEVVVLDEADHMAEMGFLPEITELLDQIPVGGQRLLFSATLDKGIDTIVDRYLVDPVTHSTDSAQASVTTMDHHILLVEPQHKKVVTAEVANREGHTIIFVRTKLGADRVALQLREQGVFAAALHGGLGQGARNRVLGAFRDGSLPVLVATDVAARGIHVDDVGVVMQVDPPADHKDYLHRAGRTARAGEKGTVITLALPHQKRMMQRIADQAGLNTSPQNVRPGDPEVAQMSGASRPSGVPIPEEHLRRLMDPPPRARGGYRGGRPGGGGRPSGGSRQGRPSGGRRY
ncbi:DEAD/DEAH box helicase [Gephyromycinifex aptenodytis]|uniref:DEAD/DEAH box helicase n=1 Tax=Gephyromycinifex aptenodytis TaxID=2716227 RepID=UPI001444B7B0|nr:DEAD/DEAH box helicase [Gephyromycinifex aptenodytis]